MELLSTHILEGRDAMVVLEQRELAEHGGAVVPPKSERVRVGLQPLLQQIERQLHESQTSKHAGWYWGMDKWAAAAPAALSYLVLGEAHLDDAGGVGDGVVGVLLKFLPPQEVGRVLAVAVTPGLLRQLRLLVCDPANHLDCHDTLTAPLASSVNYYCARVLGGFET
jgi:hypothetical protein